MGVALTEGEVIERKCLFVKTFSFCFVLFKFVVCIVRFYQSRTSALILELDVFRLYDLSMSPWYCCGVDLMRFM